VERFIVSVGAMRKAQKSSFRYRDGVMKAHAMQLEQEVDRQLDAWERERVSAEMREQHPELFPGY
jgi:energy-converting hydrogenase A subunit M